jgi:CheY-like chemotaxis protein
MGPALLVNDNKTIVERTARMLDGLGWDVHVAMSRESALRNCVGPLPRLVIVDIEMFGGEGFETISSIRRANMQTFIVAVTRGNTKELPLKVAEFCGSNHQLVGPVSATKLAEAIEVGRSSGFLPIGDNTD